MWTVTLLYFSFLFAVAPFRLAAAWNPLKPRHEVSAVICCTSGGTNLRPLFVLKAPRYSVLLALPWLYPKLVLSWASSCHDQCVILLTSARTMPQLGWRRERISQDWGNKYGRKKKRWEREIRQIALRTEKWRETDRAAAHAPPQSTSSSKSTTNPMRNHRTRKGSKCVFRWLMGVMTFGSVK